MVFLIRNPWALCCAVLVVAGDSPAKKVQTALSLTGSDISSGFWAAEEQSVSSNSRASVLDVKLPKGTDLQKEAEGAQKTLIEAIHKAQLTEAKRIAARSLTRLNAGFTSVFSRIANSLQVGINQALPAVDITLNQDEVNKALAKRTSATHSITHAMAYLANYTLNYTFTASASVFGCVEEVPLGESKFSIAYDPPLEEDKAFTFDLPTAGKKDHAEVVPFAPAPLPFAMSHKSNAKDGKDAKADCQQCPQCAECLDAESATMQDIAVDAIEGALAMEVKRMGATVFQDEPKAEVEFLCKFQKYVTQNHYRKAHPLVHPAEHEQPIDMDKSATFRSLLQRKLRAKKESKIEDCPTEPPTLASLDDGAHVAQNDALHKIFLAQYHEVVRTVNRGLVRLQAATTNEGWGTETEQMKSFDEKKWNGEFEKFKVENPVKRWAWNWKGKDEKKK